MTALQSLGPAELRARRTLKWQAAADGVLPLWVAEMDFPTAPPITEALHRAVELESFGYPLDAQGSGLAGVLTDHLQDRYAWSVDPGRVHLVGDVLHGVRLAIGQFSGPDDPVVITTPAYMPFFDVVPHTGRPQVHVPMTTVDGRAALDLDELDRAFAAGARTLILCNPYNPLGRVFTRDELHALAEVVSRHDARVISDEIHAPLVLTGTHVPYASLNAETAAHTVTVTSASKAWNLPGLKCAQAITSNDADTTAWRRLPLVATIGTSTLGIEASIAAYRDGGAWLHGVLDVLRTNVTLVADVVERMPGVRCRTNEGTYLAWLDCTELELDVEPAAWFLEHVRVMLNPGLPFRAPPRRFARLNFATPTTILHEALDRMTEALARG